MPARSAPHRGSLAYSPRKRARRIHPSVNSYPATTKLGVQAFPCYKAGMLHAMCLDKHEKSPSFNQVISVPSTIIECPPVSVFGYRAYKRTPYGLKAVSDIYSEKIDPMLERALCIPEKTSAEAKVKIETAMPTIEEFRLIVHTNPTKIELKKTPEVMELTVFGPKEEAYKFCQEKLGKELKITDVFAEGAYVDSIGVTKGKGTQGPVKRWGIRVQRRKCKGHRRHPGAIGAWNPSRVLWTVPMAGQLGFQTRTELNKRLIKIGTDGAEVTRTGGITNYGKVAGDYALIAGSLQGPKQRMVVLRTAIREPHFERAPPEIKKIIA